MESDEPALLAASLSKQKLQQNKDKIINSSQLVYFNQQLLRIEGKQLTQKIHRSIVALTFLTVQGEINAGSGVLISTDTVLTAAQNIFHKELKAENTDFKIYLGANGVAEEYLSGEAWRYPQEFKTCPSDSKLTYNYAIIKLKKTPFFDEFPSLSLACKECLKRFNKKIKLSIFGFPCVYPADGLGNINSFNGNFKSIDQNGRMKLYQYGQFGENKIAEVDVGQFKICYSISTLPGQSGSPVVVKDSIIAVHLGGQKGNFNVGRIVDVSLLNNLWKWTEQLKATPFQLESEYSCSHVEEKFKEMKFKLLLSYQGLKSVDLSNYTCLLRLDLRKNKIGSIDLSHCPRLTNINLSENQLRIIDLVKITNLTHLDLGSNKLQAIDVSTNTNLTHLYLFQNKLYTIDVRTNTKLILLRLNSNKINEIDTSKNTKLQWLWLFNNRLGRIYVCFSENVQEKIYSNHLCFDFSNQQSSVCQVQLRCEEPIQAATLVTFQRRGKAVRIIDALMKRYSNNRYNAFNCAYSFLAY